MKTKILFIAIFLFATVTYSQYNKKDSDFLNQNKSILVNKQKLDSTINYQWNNNIPVSYTHLDVYKRQSIFSFFCNL